MTEIQRGDYVVAPGERVTITVTGGANLATCVADMSRVTVGPPAWVFDVTHPSGHTHFGAVDVTVPGGAGGPYHVRVQGFFGGDFTFSMPPPPPDPNGRVHQPLSFQVQ